MFPDLFGVDGLTMNLLVVVVVLAACIVVFIYLKKFNLPKNTKIDLLITFIVTLISGFIFAVLFENLYECIKNAALHNPQHWTWSMTFYGGVAGGVAAFFLMYKFYFLRNNEPVLSKLLVIVPGAIALGHAFGRLGCFFNGCCYGKETDKWFGVLFPTFAHKVIPTQLFEMFFLFILATVLLFLAYKWNSKLTLPIYLLAYGVFRFCIEFFRGDERGQIGFLSPSQYWSILLIIIGTVILAFYIKQIRNKEKAV